MNYSMETMHNTKNLYMGGKCGSNLGSIILSVV